MLVDTVLDLMNISSSSEEGFTVEHFSLPEREDRFRVAPSSITNMPTAFMWSAEASLFVTNSVDARSTGCKDTRGTSIESELMDLLSDIPDISPTTFIDSSDEEINPSQRLTSRISKEMLMVALPKGCAQCLDDNKKQDVMPIFQQHPVKQVLLRRM